METFLVIGVDTVAKGITHGEVSWIVGGLLLITLALGGLVVWQCWGPLLRLRLDAWVRQQRQGQEGGGNEGEAVEMAVLPPLLFPLP